MKLSFQMHHALQAWPSLDRDTHISNAQAIAYLAEQHDVSASGLYRALIQRGLIEKLPAKRKRRRGAQ